ncbi:MAG: chromosome segregation protein SMC [Lachnospiraceae bacterium]|nr:chromosome segregation protein SMC [Lachnospiraceae bacterium]
MYLKSIEVYGFKSFANKITFQFHNGITAIVGPNGSGKSNVADAVRWVLGEQSAKSLRGANMQDVIFAGTETRRPLGFASVSITLDNSDHQLAVSYDEVTVTRRVYRSGESEYMLNGTQVRLKDINELFYDTGIGKEGYSIIGQGQIEKILSGKPEERRELFDEAAGIVKFKRRKQTALKKLDAERQNLTRVNDILTELTRQIGPMQKQAETAKLYLQKRDELKLYDVNLFLLDAERMQRELEALAGKQRVTEEQLSEARTEYERTRSEYEEAEREIERMDALLQKKREEASKGQLRREQFENQIRLLQEQIHTAETSDEHLNARVTAITDQLSDYEEQEKQAMLELASQKEQAGSFSEDARARQEALEGLRGEIASLELEIEQAKSAIISLLNQRATLKAHMQRYDTMAEQAQLRRSQLSQEVLRLKSEEEAQGSIVLEIQSEYDAVSARIEELNARSDAVNESLSKTQQDLTGYNQQMEEDHTRYQREASRLESLRNIAERYDGYGNSIRRVMERKEQDPGILGVVADIIRVEKEYETAIETALGGSIQNIVTDTEETAKRQIEFLKKNRFGRATFLPLSGVTARGGFQTPKALAEPGVLGLASSLAQADKKYHTLVESLLGRTIVVDQIDHAIALAGKYRHSLRIVTIDGELLSPGGSMSGGAFKNSGNLLGRRREIEDLENRVKKSRTALDGLQSRIDQTRSERNRMREELVRLKEELQKEYLSQNTAKLRLDELNEKQNTTSETYRRLRREHGEIELQAREIDENLKQERDALSQSERDEKELERKISERQGFLEQKRSEEQEAAQGVQNVQLLLSRLDQQEQFVSQNLERIRRERRQLLQEKSRYEQERESASGEIKEKLDQIAGIRRLLSDTEEDGRVLSEEITELSGKREETSASHKQFFAAREELSGRISLLDKESFRLNAQTEKITEQKDSQINYMWEEYALTWSSACELRDESFTAPAPVKKRISELKSEIKGLGAVNVNAIGEFKELSERHSFLSAQHADLLKAEADLVKIIEDLDAGMRAQFKEQFSRIQVEFDKAFRQLFGGGHGTLELVEDEDILNAGIRIIAQPPGKKLQNMMQLSGGEKSLTAIALLFAIQNLKPSPFCLLDEIEAALDESNVDRYAGYLHRLTKNTQFIIITHRRGTMNAADRLYGITMQEKGVSALVSVNLIEEELDE